jgi:hypothetical protein
MKFRNHRTYILIIALIIIIVGISFVIPLVYFSESYSGVMVDEDWVPVATDTPLPTLVASITLTPGRRSIITISPTPTSETIANCTYPLAYWVEHSESWPIILVGNTAYSASDIRVIIDNNLQGEQQILLKELYIANLNIFSGADPTDIEDTIVEANIWLQTYSLEEQMTEEEYLASIQLIQTLMDFNNGYIGPGLCPPYEAPTRTIMVESTPTVTVSPIPTSTATRFFGTPRPTDTLTPTKTPKKKLDPTNTPKPTSKPATNTPVSQPTSEPTSAPPEDTPKPTNPPEPTDPPQPPTPTPAS